MSKLLPPSNVADHGHLNIVRILLGISFLDAYALNKYIMEKGEFLSGPEEPVGILKKPQSSKRMHKKEGSLYCSYSFKRSEFKCFC